MITTFGWDGVVAHQRRRGEAGDGEQADDGGRGDPAHGIGLQLMMPAVRTSPRRTHGDPRPAGGMSTRPASAPRGGASMPKWSGGPWPDRRRPGPVAGGTGARRGVGSGAPARHRNPAAGAPGHERTRARRGGGPPGRPVSGSPDRARTGSGGRRRSPRSAAARGRRPPGRPRRSRARRCRRTRRHQVHQLERLTSEEAVRDPGRDLDPRVGIELAGLDHGRAGAGGRRSDVDERHERAARHDDPAVELAAVVVQAAQDAGGGNGQVGLDEAAARDAGQLGRDARRSGRRSPATARGRIRGRRRGARRRRSGRRAGSMADARCRSPGGAGSRCQTGGLGGRKAAQEDGASSASASGQARKRLARGERGWLEDGPAGCVDARAQVEAGTSSSADLEPGQPEDLARPVGPRHAAEVDEWWVAGDRAAPDELDDRLGQVRRRRRRAEFVADDPQRLARARGRAAAAARILTGSRCRAARTARPSGRSPGRHRVRTAS